MTFRRPASPSPLNLPSSPMDSSPMDFSTTISNSPITNPNPSPFSFANPLSRVIHSPSPAHLRSRTRRPSSLSLGFDRIKPFGFGAGSSSPSSGGGPSAGASQNSSGGGGSIIAASSGVLQPAPTIFDAGDPSGIMGRGRASSTASSMSFSFSPSRRSISLEDNPVQSSQSQESQELGRPANIMDENEETPTAQSSRRRSNRLSNLATMKRRRGVIGISGQNESESSLSNASNGRHTPDFTLQSKRGVGDDIDALAMDLAGAGSERENSSSPSKDGNGMAVTLTPPRGTVPLADVSPFAAKGGLKPAGLLRIQNELTAPFLDSETRSEAAFTRLVQSTSDLASRLRLTTSTPSSSPARTAALGRARQANRWMEDWAAKTASGGLVPAGPFGNGMAGSGAAAGNNNNSGGASSMGGAMTMNGGAGRFPESVNGDGEGGGSDETDSEGDDGAGDTTLVISRPSSSLGQAMVGVGSLPMNIGSARMGGRSRSGSGIMGDMMMIGSFGGFTEMGDGGMDLDMVSNMSSPVGTPAANSWREPAPFFQSKKRKFSAAVDAERLDIQPQAKKRKGMSPHGTSIPLSANSSSSSFNFPQPRSPHQSFQGAAQLSMTSLSASNNQMSNQSYFSPFGTFGQSFSAAGPPGVANGNGNGNGTALGMTGISVGMGHQHRKSGSISTMAWSRPGSTHSSPLLRPSSGQGGPGNGLSMPAPPGMLLGPSMLSISSTANGHGNGNAPGSLSPNSAGPFNFNFSTGRGNGVGSGGGGGNGMMSSSPSVAGQYSPAHVPLGEFGAPLTGSPTNRPMMKLPDRTLHALGATGARGGRNPPGHAGPG